MKRILFTTLTLIFFLNCNNDVTQSSEENQLLGKWTEPFSWTNIFECVTIGWDTECPEVSETSTIEFTESTFEVKILPPSRTFIVEDDTIYVGWSGDTLYSGSYETNEDTIFFYFQDSNDPRKMRYWFENDSLTLANVSGRQLVVMDGDTSYIATFSMASFVWGNAWGKTYGVFSKIE